MSSNKKYNKINNSRYIDINEKNLFFNFFINKKKIAIISHIDPDGDAIASLASIYFICEYNSINSDIFLFNPLPFLEYNKWNLDIQPLSNFEQKNYDAVIFVDTPSITRSGLTKDYILNISSLCIDHHIDNQFFCDLNIVAPYFCSTTEIIYELVKDSYIDKEISATSKNNNTNENDKYNQIKIELCEALFMGILFDTYYFNTENVDDLLLQRAAVLQSITSCLHKLRNILFKNQNPMIYKFWGHILTNINLYFDGQLVIAKADRNLFQIFEEQYENFSESVATEGFINHLMNLRNVNLAIFIKEMKEEVKVSIRSTINIASILANKFGGGGHSNAAAFKIKRNNNFNIDDLENEIIKFIRQENLIKDNK